MRIPGAPAAVPLVLALTLTAALAGCAAGGGAEVATATGGGGGPAASATPTLDPDERNLRFAQCMRENGVDMPDPRPGEPVMLRIRKGQEAAVEKARQACKQYAPVGGTGADRSRNAERMREIARCMRDNGVPDFPDPDPEGRIKVGKGVTDDPDFPAAEAKCRPEKGGS
ncbi:hypothetical protein GCM10010466_21760 [Planomonospora alba]|uniref:Lipoprotein n=1 Tax=Planomonospora alba TaxID=161354 RepID=A0ABP6N1Q0_9ACTN